MTKDSHRQQFPALINKTYFNYGGQGPLSQSALHAIMTSYERIQQRGPFSQEINAWIQEEINFTKNVIASELKVPSQTITLTEDVTVGCNIPLWGINWHQGDHIILSDCEHPGIIAALGELQRRFSLEVSVFPLLKTLNEGDPVAILADYLRPKTRLVVLSHILWNTGQVLPLKRFVDLCHNPPFLNSNQGSENQTNSPKSQENQPHYSKIRVLVDAAQSVGVLPLDLIDLGVDFYAFTGHKWWCGAEGLGALYISQDALTEVHPTFIGWRGIMMDSQGNPTGWKPDGRRYEIATSATPLYGALRESLNLHNSWGNVEERYTEICRLSQYLWGRLSEIPGVKCLKNLPPESGLVSFQLTNHPHHADVVSLLEKKGIFIRTILHPDCIRACVHYFSLESEIDRLVDEIITFTQI